MMFGRTGRLRLAAAVFAAATVSAVPVAAGEVSVSANVTIVWALGE